MSTQIVRLELKVKQCLPEKLDQINLFSDTGQVVLYQTGLEYSDNLSIGGKSKIYLNQLERVVISIKSGICRAPGTRVERMGIIGWKGRILEVAGDRALVSWVGYPQGWHPLYELYPLDELGKPLIPNGEINIFQTALRGRLSLLSSNQVTDQLSFL